MKCNRCSRSRCACRGATGATGATGGLGFSGGYLKFSGYLLGTPETIVEAYLSDNAGLAGTQDDGVTATVLANLPTTGGFPGPIDYPISEPGLLTSFAVNLQTNNNANLDGVVQVFLSVNGADIATLTYNAGSSPGQQQATLTTTPFPIVPGNVVNVRVTSLNTVLILVSATAGVARGS